MSSSLVLLIKRWTCRMIMNFIWSLLWNYHIFCWRNDRIISRSWAIRFSSKYFMFSSYLAVVLVNRTVYFWIMKIGRRNILEVIIMIILVRMYWVLAWHGTKLRLLLSYRNHFFTSPLFEFGLQMMNPVDVFFFFSLKSIYFIGKLKFHLTNFFHHYLFFFLWLFDKFFVLISVKDLIFFNPMS